jgi:hypothetical protein
MCYCSVYLQAKEGVKLQLENQHSDSNFQATLQELDERELFCEKEEGKVPVKEKQKHALHASGLSESAVEFCKVPRNDTEETESNNDKELLNEKCSKAKETTEVSSQARTSSDLLVKNKKCKFVSKSMRNESYDKEEVRSLQHTVKRCDSSPIDDAFEKKKQHAMQYQRYLQREGPKNPGGKVIPQVLH